MIAAYGQWIVDADVGIPSWLNNQFHRCRSDFVDYES
jgi:hypothetical protein